MRRNFLYIGIALIIVGIAVGLFSLQSVVPSAFSNATVKTISVNSTALAYLPVYMNQTGLAIVYFNASSPVDFYFANATGFAAMSSAKPANVTSAAVGKEGKGVYEVYLNATSGAFPYTLSGLKTPSYVANVTGAMQIGTYYAAFLGLGSGTESVVARSVVVPLSAINSTFSKVALYGGVTIVIILAGIVLIILSFVMKDKQKQEEGMDENAKKAYEKIEKKRS